MCFESTFPLCQFKTVRDLCGKYQCSSQLMVGKITADAAFVTQLLPLVSPTRSQHELLYGQVRRDPVLDSLISPFWVLRVSICVVKLPV